MPYRSFIEQKLNEEMYWESHEKIWLDSLLQSPLYEQLKREYDPETLDRNLKILAEHRTRIYRIGPGLLLDEQRKKSKYFPHAFNLIESVQAKKLFNFGLQWRAEKIRIPGLWHSWQMHAVECNAWSTKFIAPFGEEDLLFLKHLVQDDLFLETPEGWKFGHTIQSDEIRHFREHPSKWNSISEFYPLLYERYDDWFNTAHLLELPDLRSQTEDRYLEIYQEVRDDKPIPVPDSEPGKPYHMEWTPFANAWFRECEPHHVKELFQAHELFFPDGWAAADYEYELAWDHLVESDPQPYPRGDVNWKESILMAGRRAFYARVGEVLDEAFAEYQLSLKQNIPLKKSYISGDVNFVPEPIIEWVKLARKHLGLTPFPDDYYLKSAND